MSEPIGPAKCACGWPRPLFAITRAEDGAVPHEALTVGYDCPQCGVAFVCGEIAIDVAAHAVRARAHWLALSSAQAVAAAASRRAAAPSCEACEGTGTLYESPDGTRGMICPAVGCIGGKLL